MTNTGGPLNTEMVKDEIKRHTLDFTTSNGLVILLFLEDNIMKV